MLVGAEGSGVLMARAETEFWLQSVDTEVYPCEATLFHCHPEQAAGYGAWCVEVSGS